MEVSTNLGRVSIVPRGEYDPAVQYERLDIVRYAGSGYLVLRPVQGVTPDDGADYMLITEKGGAGDTGATGPRGEQGETGPHGPRGEKGDPGSSIASIERTSGTGAPGTTDTYTITLTNGVTTTFQVYNGADGAGAGDMTKAVYDPRGKNTDVFAYVDNGLALKQPLLTGQPGQVVGFDAAGAAVAQDAPDQAGAVTVPGGGVMELGQELGDGPYTFEFTEDGEEAVSAAQVSYDTAQSGLQAETVQGAVDALSARTARMSSINLMDNGYFAGPVNQRGQTSYSGVCFAIDRWLFYNEKSNTAATLELLDDCILMQTKTSDAQNHCLIQRVEIDTYRKYRGKTITVSLLARGAGTLILYGEYMRTDSTVWQKANVHALSDDYEMYTLTYEIPNELPSDIAAASLGSFMLGNYAGSIYAKAIKAELGPVQTLAHQDVEGNWVLNDPPPDKAMELAKCQRYYQIFATQSMRPAKAIDFRPPMRANPTLGTIVIDGVTYYTADANL